MKRLYPLFVFLIALVAVIWFAQRLHDKRYITEEEEIIEEPAETMEEIKTDSIPGDFRAWVSLTPAESKRLIAKGLLLYGPFADQLNDGDLIVCRGTTNHYIAEELLGGKMEPGRFTNGRIAPANSPFNTAETDQITELYFHNGLYTNLSFDEALDKLRRGSVILKGANLINYDTKKAAVLVVNSDDGTMGKILPHIGDRGARLIIPVGLEKNSSSDIDALVKKMNDPAQGIPRLLLLPGELFTEIEAIKQFAYVDVTQIASGGVGGAEGAVSLVIRGTQDNVEEAMRNIKKIQGEKAFFSRDSI